MTRMMTVYIDYKSPYAYLAVTPIYALEDEFDVAIDWLPLDLDIPSYLGSARLDGAGQVLEQDRSAHQWRRVRYAYMDVRRRANMRGLVIYGTRKIWISSIANAGLLWAKRQGRFRPYNDFVFDKFWRRELDIENPLIVAEALDRAQADGRGFLAWHAAEGLAEVSRLKLEAEQRGVFGVPSFILDGELYWGGEHLGELRERLARDG